MGSLAQLLILADGRLPSGGHANGGGVEWAASHDDFNQPQVLQAWILGRLETVGVVDAAFAVAALPGDAALLSVLDVELSARMPGERARLVSRQLGRQFQRLAGTAWPAAGLGHHRDPHVALAIGVTCGALGASAEETATVVLHQLVATTTTAAVRLLALDPMEVAAMQVRLAPEVARLAEDAPVWVAALPEDLPAATSALADLLAEDHGCWQSRLFVA